MVKSSSKTIIATFYRGTVQISETLWMWGLDNGNANINNFSMIILKLFLWSKHRPLHYLTSLANADNVIIGAFHIFTHFFAQKCSFRFMPMSSISWLTSAPPSPSFSLSHFDYQRVYQIFENFLDNIMFESNENFQRWKLFRLSY